MGKTFFLHTKDMTKPAETGEDDFLFNGSCFIFTENTPANFRVANAVFPPYMSKASEATVVKHREFAKVFRSYGPGFGSIQKDRTHSCLIHTSFSRQPDITASPQVLQIRKGGTSLANPFRNLPNDNRIT